MRFVLLQFLFNVLKTPMLFLGIGKKRLAAACLQIRLNNGESQEVTLERFKILVKEWKQLSLVPHFEELNYREQVEYLVEIVTELQAKCGLQVSVNAYSFHPMIPVIPEEVWSADDITVGIEEFAKRYNLPMEQLVESLGFVGSASDIDPEIFARPISDGFAPTILPTPEQNQALVDTLMNSSSVPSQLNSIPEEMAQSEYINRQVELMKSAEEASSPEAIARYNEERRTKYNKGKELLEVGLLACNDRQDLEALMKKVMQVSDDVFDTFALEYDRDHIVKIVDPFADENVENLNDFLTEVKRILVNKSPTASEELDDFSFTTGVCACMAKYEDYQHPVISISIWDKSH